METSRWCGYLDFHAVWTSLSPGGSFWASDVEGRSDGGGDELTGFSEVQASLLVGSFSFVMMLPRRRCFEVY